MIDGKSTQRVFNWDRSFFISPWWSIFPIESSGLNPISKERSNERWDNLYSHWITMRSGVKVKNHSPWNFFYTISILSRIELSINGKMWTSFTRFLYVLNVSYVQYSTQSRSSQSFLECSITRFLSLVRTLMIMTTKLL